MENKNKEKILKIVPILSFVVGLLVAVLVMFFISGCMSLPERLPNEPMACFQGRYCGAVNVKANNKDFAGCSMTFSNPCKKILIDEYCKEKYPDNQSACRERLN
jgi:hypothetical protein